MEMDKSNRSVRIVARGCNIHSKCKEEFRGQSQKEIKTEKKTLTEKIVQTLGSVPV